MTRYSIYRGSVSTTRFTEKIFNRQRSRKLPSDIQQIALRKLHMLNRSQSLQDLRVPPSNRLEKLSGDRQTH